MGTWVRPAGRKPLARWHVAHTHLIEMCRLPATIPDGRNPQLLRESVDPDEFCVDFDQQHLILFTKGNRHFLAEMIVSLLDTFFPPIFILVSVGYSQEGAILQIAQN